MARKVIEFGKWRGQPIRWLVLGKNAEGKYLCLAEKGLFEDSFTGKGIIKPEDCLSGHEADTWDKCGLRLWLNTIFIDEAFTPEERVRLNVTRVIGDQNPLHRSVVQHSDTLDKVFLLSVRETMMFLSQDEVGIGSKWWLRTREENSYKRYKEFIVGMTCVPEDGDLSSGKFLIGFYNTKAMVRPAIVIDM